jgi:hypothetical protein
VLTTGVLTGQTVNALLPVAYVISTELSLEEALRTVKLTEGFKVGMYVGLRRCRMT